MSSSHKRIIKLRRPVTGLTIVSSQGGNGAVDVLETISGDTDKPVVENVSPAIPPSVTIGEEELENIRSEAYKAGRQEGLETGSTQALAEIEKALKMLHNLTETIEQHQQLVFGHSEEACLALLFAMSEKIVGALNTPQQDVIRSTLRRVLKVAEIAGRVKILVSPQDLQSVREMENELRQHLPDLKEMSIIDDETIASGGCVIETDLGKVDARVQTQLNEMVDNLQKLYQEMAQSNGDQIPEPGLN